MREWAEAEGPTSRFAQCSPAEWEREKRALVESANSNGGQWRYLLATAAAPMLGISIGEALLHPAVKRAQELLEAPSLGDHYKSAGMSREEAERLDTPIAREDRGMREPYVPAPPGFPTQYTDVVLAHVRHLGGHPGLALGEDKLELGFSETDILAVPDIGAEALIAWGSVEELISEGPDTVHSRVTIPRIALGGILAWAKKKKTPRSHT